MKNLLTRAFGTRNGRPVIRQVDAVIPGLPPALDGLKIGQISDMHLGPKMPRSSLEQAVALLAANKPDLVALTGDFVDDPHYATDLPDILAPLKPRLGSFACMGNHDYLHGRDAVPTHLCNAGIKMLRNQHQLVNVDGSQLCIIGVDDIGHTGAYAGDVEPADDLPAALADSPSSDVIRVLLVHNPDMVTLPVFAKVTASYFIHLVLSGHTHGGQVRLPLIGSPFMPKKWKRWFSGGLARVAGTLIHVSRGAGSWVPLRINCPHEVNMITLRSKYRNRLLHQITTIWGNRVLTRHLRRSIKRGNSRIS